MSDPETEADELATRMVFADKITVGSIILVQCFGASCTVSATSHTVKKVHELAVLDLRVDDRLVTAIVSDEDGNQHGWSNGANMPVRIVAF